MFVLRKTGTVIPGRYAYYEEQTKTPFSGYSTLRALAAEVKRHRDSNNIPVGTGFITELSDWNCRRMDEETRSEWCMEEGSNGGPGKRIAAPMRREDPTGFDGSHIWRALHTYALLERPDAVQRAQYVAGIASQIPCGHCRRSWKKLVKDNPLPTTATPQEFFAWTVSRHSDVSAKIGKAEMSLADALALWSS